MVVKLSNLAAWRVVNPGDGILLPGGKRRVRIAFNTPAQTEITVLHANKAYLLGVVTGFDEFEFGVDEAVEVHLDSDKPCYWRTDDGDQTATQPSTDTFTKMMERKERNPELEYMMYMAEVNANKRAEQMIASVTAMAERTLRENGVAATRGTPQPKPVEASGSGATTGTASGGTTTSGDAGTNGAGEQSSGAGSNASSPVPKQPEASGATVAGK